jgi:hypothetical protein
MSFQDSITAVITTSPTPFNPRTGHIDWVYESIRHYLPDAEIIVLVDGVREEQRHLEKQYAEYKENLRKKNWRNVHLIEFLSYHHQAGMFREAISQVKTPLVLWVEHDFPLNYMPIDWSGLVSTLLDGELSCIRLNHDSDLRFQNRPNQRQQYRDITGKNMVQYINKYGVPLLPVVNWDSLPHIAKVEFYHFLFGCFKEAKIHLDCTDTHIAIEQNHIAYPVGLYAPDGDMKRFENLMGRGSEPKYPMVL